MKKTIQEIYALAVCFVTIVCAVIATGFGFYDLLEIAKPEFTLSAYEYKRFQSNDTFCRDECKNDNEDKIIDEEITKKRLVSYELALKNEQRDAVQSLVKVFVILVIDAGVFWLHWRLARRSRESINTT